jgi:hypothetical protein
MIVIATLGSAAAGLVVGAAGAWWLGARRRGAAADGAANPTEGVAGQAEGVAGPVDHAAAAASTGIAAPPEPADTADRDVLVQACIELSDRLRDSNPALWRRLCRGLAAIGVETAVVDGQRFDPEAHDAVGREPTSDAAQHLTVASTEFCGFTDRGRLLRRPEVVVYRMEETG